MNILIKAEGERVRARQRDGESAKCVEGCHEAFEQVSAAEGGRETGK